MHTIKLSIDELEPGMKLGADAMHLTGRVLLPKGAELTEKHIKLFKQWGVVEAEVESNEEIHEKVAVPPELLAKEEEKLASMMIHANMEHPLIAELHRLLLKRNIDALSKANVKNDLDS